MIEIRLHGRGGQGAVIASKILAVAMFNEGKYVQAFPKFGVERRGAPVEAFLRVNSEKILIRSDIQKPDHVVVLDHTLIDVIDVTAGLADKGGILINTALKPGDFDSLTAYRVACVDAGRIATDLHLGSPNAPIVNTAICGSFARYSGLVELNAVSDAIREEVPIKADENVEAATIAFNSTIV